MLSLFLEKEEPISVENALKRAREILVSSLNKGHIPSWEEFFSELPTLDSADDLEAIKTNFIKLTKWPFLLDILQCEATEFFFHGPENSQKMNFKGEKSHFDVPLKEEDWQLWLEILSISFKQNWNVENPFVSFYGRIGDKSLRISMVHSSTSPEGVSKLVLRNLGNQAFPLSAYGDVSFLNELVKKKSNILVAGSTGSGKTSLMSSLTELIDQDDHLVILEDTFEIKTSLRYTTRFLAGQTHQTSLKSYLAYSLRLTPDRIILGEMRSHEVVPFLMAMNTGHKGLMGTIHASSAYDALNRIALLFTLYCGEAGLAYEKVMELICRNLEYVVFMENKKVKEVIKILGSDKGMAFYETITPLVEDP